MTDTVTPTQADLIDRIKSDTAFTTPDEIVKVLETQAAEIARLRGAGLTLLRECERNGVADNVLAGLIPEEKLRDGSGMCESTKNLRRAMNEFRAALSAQRSEQEKPS